MDNQELEIKALYYKALECYRRPEPSSHEEGFYFLKQAADMGCPEADKLMGALYMSGQYAPYPDANGELAILSYQSAAEAGDPEAMYWLSQCYEFGKGVKQDLDQAARWKAEAQEWDPDRKNGKKTEPVPEASELIEKAEEASGETEEPEEAESSAETEDPEEAEPSEETEIPVKAESLEKTVTPVDAESPAETSPETDRRELQKFLTETQEAREARSKELPLRYAAIFGTAGLVAVCLAIIVIRRVALPGAVTGHGLFLAISAAAAGAVTVLGIWQGLRLGRRRAEERNAYEESAFYYGFRMEDTGSEESGWLYGIYRSLAGAYVPLRTGEQPDPDQVRKARGFLMPGWIFRTEKGMARPEFVLVTEKAVFVVRTFFGRGRLEGAWNGKEWTLLTDNLEQEEGKEVCRPRRLLNLLEENRFCRYILREEWGRHFPEVDRLPFVNVLMFPAGVDLRGLKLLGAGDLVMTVQGSGDKLRGQVKMKENRLDRHGFDLGWMAASLEEISCRQASRVAGLKQASLPEADPKPESKN